MTFNLTFGRKEMTIDDIKEKMLAEKSRIAIKFWNFANTSNWFEEDSLEINGPFELACIKQQFGQLRKELNDNLDILEERRKEMNYILCHKCAGVLSGKVKNTPLNYCRCISGWIRGFEKSLTFEEAKQEQIQMAKSWIQLYKRQERDQSWIDKEEAIIAKLQK